MADAMQEAGYASLPIEVGSPFPDLVLPSIDNGAPRRVSEFRGRKLALHVFASW